MSVVHHPRLPAAGLLMILTSGIAWVACVAGEPPAAEAPHWAFVPPVKTPGMPAIDALLSSEHAKRGLTPQPAAENAIWLRRVYLDLIGLPPSLDELAAFERESAHNRQAAKVTVVDRLLASPHYGERWGRHFMDIWRYSDWYGLGAQLRYSQKHTWHWRDWIVESLNTDKGYDHMVQEMLAGDELAPENPDVLRATGFLARNYYLFNRTTWLDDVVEHTSKAFLGITMNCVKCHDHKFDPISHKEYYAFRAIFEPYHVRLDVMPGELNLEKDGLPRAYDLHLERPTYLHQMGDEKQPDTSKPIRAGLPAVLSAKPLEIHPVSLPLAASRPESQRFFIRDQIHAAKVAVIAAETQSAAASSDTGAAVADLRLRVSKLHLHAINAALRADEKSRPAAISANLALELAKAELALAEAAPDKRKAAEAVVTKARESLASGKGEPFRLVASLKALEGPDETDATRYLPFPQTSTGRRLALAGWITQTQNPLTARVLVNHVWLRHFGQPLVANVFDFGAQSQPPPLQALLDWLAIEFMEKGWSIKHLHRLMVLSDAYAMTSSNAGCAGANRHGDPDNHCYWRMNPVRMDSQTVRDSLLHLAGRLDLTLGGPTLNPKAEEKSSRRSLYFNHSRDDANLFLDTFDNANVLDCYRRAESIVPQQALALMNGKVALTSAAAIAEKLDSHSEDDFIRSAFRFLLAVDPTPAELQTSQEALADLGGGSQARVALIHTLLNHHDFITIR